MASTIVFERDMESPELIERETGWSQTATASGTKGNMALFCAERTRDPRGAEQGLFAKFMRPHGQHIPKTKPYTHGSTPSGTDL
ncbi:hypothetical protein GX51_00418 [Blastomyces parvus]|uniref:Uncharacterized protein n=1 Tax=Blastomyces parvus TaxID=2060905 RepID=A0A2B7XMB8_9EURO|nr:hypothetical protein GX51_00418 [Blastomyces parvus]